MPVAPAEDRGRLDDPLSVHHDAGREVRSLHAQEALQNLGLSAQNLQRPLLRLISCGFCPTGHQAPGLRGMRMRFFFTACLLLRR